MIAGIVAAQMRAAVVSGGPSAVYWRVSISAIKAGNYAAIGEIEMRATIGGSDQCSGGTASAISTITSASAAFDNDPVTTWASNWGSAWWIQYQFPSAVSVAELSIQSENGAQTTGNGTPKDFTLQYSSDGSSWTTALTVTGQTGWANSTVRNFIVP